MTSPLAAWTAFVVLFATLSYSIRFTEGKPPKDLLYRWSTAEGGLIQFAVIGLIVYAIAGLGQRLLFLFQLRFALPDLLVMGLQEGLKLRRWITSLR